LIITVCYYSVLVGVQSIAISMSVCLSAWTSQNHMSRLSKFSLCVSCGCSSVLLWWHCRTLCTSGLMDDVMFYI